jgi:hypothetical protein
MKIPKKHLQKACKRYIEEKINKLIKILYVLKDAVKHMALMQHYILT